ncbi:MAG: ROK family protein [Caldilineales bacterium]|nr:ROK family protein [Caldilineales bacterium]
MTKRNDNDRPVIGIDLGGTKILAAAVDAKGNILGRSKARSVPKGAKDPGPELVAERMAEAVRGAAEKAGLELSKFAAVGASAPGPVDIFTGRVMGAVNLPSWEKPYDLGPDLSEKLGLPVFVDNDVNLGTLGEAEMGAGKGVADLLGIFVGTGIGGGVVLNGKLRRGSRWSAGEIGHMMMSCEGRDADVEFFASRGAISRNMSEAVTRGESPIVKEILRKRGDDRITSGVIRKALKQGDPVTRRILHDAQNGLGLLIASVVNLLDPDMIILGGGLVESLGDSYIDPVRDIAYANFFLRHDREKIRIVRAALGDDAVVLGASVLARQMLAGQVPE